MVRESNFGSSGTCPIHIRVAKNLRMLRIFQDLSQQQIAKTVNMSRSCYAAVEAGTRQADVNTIVLLSDFYGISADRLLKEDLTSLYSKLLQESSGRFNR